MISFLHSKKAILDDLFDFLFLIMIAFFTFMFIHAALVQSVKNRDGAAKIFASEILAQQGVLVEARLTFENLGTPSTTDLEKSLDHYSKILPLKIAKPPGGELTTID